MANSLLKAKTGHDRSRDKYRILNAGSSEPAKIEYTGPWEEFLAGNLPAILVSADTTDATVVEGSMLEKFRQLPTETFPFNYSEKEGVGARVVAEAYGLLKSTTNPDRVVTAARVAARLRQIRDEFVNEWGSRCFPVETRCFNGEPQIVVSVPLFGNTVSYAVYAHDFGNEDRKEYLSEEEQDRMGDFRLQKTEEWMRQVYCLYKETE